MARPKKTAPSTKTAKTSTKRVVSKAVKPKKLAEDATLHQRFADSLVNLEKFWEKKALGLKKQLQSTQAKLGKASKGSATWQKRQEEMVALKKELAQAKLSSQKFAKLRKAIKQFESEWTAENNKVVKLKKAKESPEKKKKEAAATKPKKTKTVATTKKTAVTKKSKPEAVTPFHSSEDLENEDTDDVEDLFLSEDDEVAEFDVIDDFGRVEDEEDLSYDE